MYLACRNMSKLLNAHCLSDYLITVKLKIFRNIINYFATISLLFLSGPEMVDLIYCTVKRPKFGNGPLVRHPLSKLLKNHISARTGVSDLVQRGDLLYIFSGPIKKEIIGSHH
jgi:hypothetical protein